MTPAPQTPAHVQMKRYVDLLPGPRADIAAALGVSESTLYGWIQVGGGEEVSRRRAGSAPPGPAMLATARELLSAHGGDVAAALDLPE